MSAGKAEFVLGSVQLGLAYGITNKTGKPSHAAALNLVRQAVDSGITQFDTARAYGDSEARLGEALEGRDVFTITKLSPLAELPADATREEARAAVDVSFRQSCAALRQDRLRCLLLHRAAHMTSHGGAIWQRLLELRAEGFVEKLGVSVQSPEEALAALASPDVRHIQMPFNILDWRWRRAGVVALCQERPDVTVHARSVFLQGLLASGDPAIWPPVPGIDAEHVLAVLGDLAGAFGRESVADLCLAYVRGQDFVHGVVIGLETTEQLDLNLRLSIKHPLSQAECAEAESKVPQLQEELLNPARWPKR